MSGVRYNGTKRSVAVTNTKTHKHVRGRLSVQADHTPPPHGTNPRPTHVQSTSDVVNADVTLDVMTGRSHVTPLT